MAGASWEATWRSVEETCARAGVELTSGEKLALYEAYDGAYDWSEAA